MGYAFLEQTLRDLLRSGSVSIDDSVLVVCGGPNDADSLRNVGFSRATVSNLADSYNEGLAPYSWDRQDVEDLSYEDDAFDLVMVHMGLHHCQSAHRGLTEMYRVARKAVLVLENSDNLAMRLAIKLGLAPEFEVEAVTSNHYVAGGLRNGPIPNYIYRWTEDEVRKTITMYDPAHSPAFRFFYNLRLPMDRLAHTGRLKARMLLLALAPVAKLAQLMTPRVIGNEFGFAIVKRSEMRPWLIETPAGPRVSAEWAKRASADYDNTRH